jgi:hypothetical protein
MRQRNFLRLESDAAVGGAPVACAAEPGAHDAGAAGEQLLAAGTVVGWNRLALQAIRSVQPGAAMAARALAMLHTCMYNAWAAYDDDARQTAHGVAVRLPRAERSAASKASAMSHAAWMALSGLFPALNASFDAWMAGLGLDPSAASGQLTPAGIGHAQAAAMLDAWRREGGGEPATLPVPAGEAPDPGHWCLLAQSVSERDRHDDDRDVRLFFALTDAVVDAGDACGPAAGEVLRRFTGGALPGAEQEAGRDAGREAGARAYDKARRYWEGKL